MTTYILCVEYIDCERRTMPNSHDKKVSADINLKKNLFLRIYYNIFKTRQYDYECEGRMSDKKGDVVPCVRRTVESSCDTPIKKNTR